MDKPREHLSEEHRWDLRVTVVYRDGNAAYSPDKITEADYAAIIKGSAGRGHFQEGRAAPLRNPARALGRQRGAYEDVSGALTGRHGGPFAGDTTSDHGRF